MDILTVINAFGGVNKLADALGAPYTTVHSWERKRHAPHWRWPQIREAASVHGIELPDESDPPQATDQGAA